MFDKARQWLKLRWQETDLFVDELRLSNPEPQEVIDQFKAVYKTTDRSDAEVAAFVQEMCDASK